MRYSVAFSTVRTGMFLTEYSGISLNMENSGNSVQPQEKIVTVRHSNICVK